MTHIELLEKFIIELVPPEIRPTINQNFKSFNQDCVATTAGVFNNLHAMIIENPDIRCHVLNGIILGVFFTHSLPRAPQVEEIIKIYLDSKQKMRGDNVIDFARACVGRR